jgi:hypothetical protein
MVVNIVDVGWATSKSGCLPITGKSLCSIIREIPTPCIQSRRSIDSPQLITRGVNFKSLTSSRFESQNKNKLFKFGARVLLEAEVKNVIKIDKNHPVVIKNYRIDRERLENTVVISWNLRPGEIEDNWIRQMKIFFVKS